MGFVPSSATFFSCGGSIEDNNAYQLDCRIATWGSSGTEWDSDSLVFPGDAAWQAAASYGDQVLCVAEGLHIYNKR